MISVTTRLKWHGLKLYYGGRKLSEIEPDARYPEMWRVIEADGTRSDMVNLSRVKDAAVRRASQAIEMIGLSP